MFWRDYKLKMELNALGKIANEYWLNISQHYSEVELDEFIIMPNHIHGIIVLKYISTLETGQAPSLHSLGNVVGSFKSGITKWAHKNGYKDIKWQTRFYDRIIRNEKELYQIRKYIQHNPLRWEMGN
jgi:REP element-mobilizing transposase RayT